MKRALILLASLCLGVGFAHADLESASPEQNAVLAEPPPEIVLSYSEAVEVRFSTFKVYPLAVTGDLTQPQDRLRIGGAAATLVSEVLPLQGDEESRVDAGVLTEARTADTVTLALRTLEPGFYVVMWRVLSVDTHTSQGSFVFEYAPNN